MFKLAELDPKADQNLGQVTIYIICVVNDTDRNKENYELL